MGVLDYSNIFADFIFSLSQGWDFINSSIVDTLDDYLSYGWVNNLITKPLITQFISLSGNADLTWLGFLIYFMGAGLGAFFIYSFVIWLLNILT